MPPRRKIVPIVSMLALTLASALAWACAPAAPAVQEGGPAVEAEPTATATPTPTPSATPVYYPEVIPQRNPELNPILNAFIIRNMAASSSGGASGQAEPGQQTIPMAITVSKYDDSADMRGFLESNGAVINHASTSSLPEGTTSFKFNGVPFDPPYTWSDGSTLFLADVPITLLPELVERTDPESIGYTGDLPYPNLTLELNELVIADEAGLLPSGDWPTALVSVGITDPRPYIELTRYLTDKKDEGAVIIAEDYYQYMTYGAEVPLGLIAPMSELPGVEQVELFVYPPPPGYVEEVLRLHEEVLRLHEQESDGVAGD